MKRIIKHLALFLLGIFLFPALFQALHIAWDSPHCVHCHSDECTTAPVVKYLEAGHVSISQIDQGCPICEYQFSINDLPESIVFSSLLRSISSIRNVKLIEFRSKKLHSHKTSRAPPLLQY